MKILHLGLGHFHRAHQAWYVERLNRQLASAAKAPWSIASFGMRSSAVAMAMKELSHAYELEQVEGDRIENDTIRSIQETYTLQSDPGDLRRLAADPELVAVTLTVTEKAYSLPQEPISIFDALSLIAQERATTRLERIPVISCDNLNHNSSVLQARMREFAPDERIEDQFLFLNSMVDRIVPHSPDLRRLRTEIFSQWVIEARGLSDHHPLRLFKGVGVEFVTDVAPYERMKLRLLNAAHSLMAYWGLNRGFEFVHEVIQNKEGLNIIEGLWAEVLPTLDLPNDMNGREYCDRLKLRFNNPALPHRLSQIAQDRDAKIPQRILPSLAVAQKRGTAKKILELALTESFNFSTKK